LARLGGDEFAIIQRHIRSPDEASALSSRIIAALGAPFVLAGRIAQIGVSIGIVVTPAAQAARDLASKADMALYEAKASGRNQYKIFDPHMQDAASYRETIGAELKAAHLTVPQRVA
jgi:diguanylate cyclase (GGDEF)-like protein